jgi:hypothetical protein
MAVMLSALCTGCPMKMKPSFWIKKLKQYTNLFTSWCVLGICLTNMIIVHLRVKINWHYLFTDPWNVHAVYFSSMFSQSTQCKYIVHCYRYLIDFLFYKGIILYMKKYLCQRNIFTNRYYRNLTMVYNTQNYWVFGLCPSPGILKTKNTTFWKLDLFPSSGEGRHLLC